MRKVAAVLFVAVVASQFQCKSTRRGSGSQLMDTVNAPPPADYTEAALKAINGPFAAVLPMFESADPSIVSIALSYFNYHTIGVDYTAADLEAVARKLLPRKIGTVTEALIEAVGLQCNPVACPVASFGTDIVTGAQGVAGAEVIGWLQYRLSRQPVAYSGLASLEGTTSDPKNEYEKRYLISSLLLASGRDPKQITASFVDAAVPIAQRILADANQRIDSVAPVDASFLLITQAATMLYSKVDVFSKTAPGLAVPSDFVQLIEAYRRLWAFVDKTGGEAQRTELTNALQAACTETKIPGACKGLAPDMGGYVLSNFAKGADRVSVSEIQYVSDAAPPEAIVLGWPTIIGKVFCPTTAPTVVATFLNDACLTEYTGNDTPGNVAMALVMSRDSISISNSRFKSAGNDADLLTTLPSALPLIQFFDSIQARVNFGSAKRMTGLDPVMIHQPVLGETYKSLFGPYLASVARVGLPQSPDSYELLHFFNGLELSRLTVDPRLTIDGISLVDKLRTTQSPLTALPKQDFAMLKNRNSPISQLLCKQVSPDAAEVSAEVVVRAPMYARILFSFPYAVAFGSRDPAHAETDFSPTAYSAKASLIGNFRAFKTEFCTDTNIGSLIVTDLFSGDGVTKRVAPYLSGVCGFTQNAPYGDECRMLLGSAQDIIARKSMYRRKF